MHLLPSLCLSVSLSLCLSVSLSLCLSVWSDVLEDTAIGSVGEEELCHLGPLMKENEGGNRERGKLGPQQPPVVRHKKRSLENTPGRLQTTIHYESEICVFFSVGLKLAAVLSGSSTTPLKRHSAEATPPTTPTNDITTSTTPGTVPPPPPTPVVGPGGVPIPPPPPPSFSSAQQPLMKRVNWQKMARTDGTVWGEVCASHSHVLILPFPRSHTPIPMFSYSHTTLLPHSHILMLPFFPFLIPLLQLSGIAEAIELAELESQFALRKSRGQQTAPPSLTPPPCTLQSQRRWSRARDQQYWTLRNHTTSVSAVLAFCIVALLTANHASPLKPRFSFSPAILLKHLKLPASAIREAVLSCDSSVLREQHIRLMATFAPDKREVRGH